MTRFGRDVTRKHCFQPVKKPPSDRPAPRRHSQRAILGHDMLIIVEETIERIKDSGSRNRKLLLLRGQIWVFRAQQ
jgi:hypothetical protein